MFTSYDDHRGTEAPRESKESLVANHIYIAGPGSGQVMAASTAPASRQRCQAWGVAPPMSLDESMHDRDGKAFWESDDGVAEFARRESGED